MDEIFMYIFNERNCPFINWIDNIVKLLNSIFGDVSQGFTQVPAEFREGKIVYNKAVWDLEKISSFQNGSIKPNSKELIDEVKSRVERYGNNTVEFLYTGKWKNPYSKTETFLSSSISAELEDMGNEDLYRLKVTFYQIDNWFSLYCKPLTESSELIKRSQKSIWNITPSGLIIPLQEKLIANRNMLFDISLNLIDDLSPLALCIAFTEVFFNKKLNLLTTQSISLSKEGEKLPILLYFKEKVGILHKGEKTVEIDKSFTIKTKKGFSVHINPDYFK